MDEPHAIATLVIAATALIALACLVGGIIEKLSARYRASHPIAWEGSEEP